MVLVGGLYAFFLSRQEVKEAQGGSIIRTANFLGTGTSSIASSHFGAPATTTSNIVNIGSQIDTLDLDLYSIDASTTPSVNIHILKSSLPRCAVTNGIGQNEWVDALSYDDGATGKTVTIDTTTSTIRWIPVAKAGQSSNWVQAKKYQLTNLNAYCVKLIVAASSSNMYIQGTLKSLSF